MTGAPVLLEEEELEEVTAHAEELIVEEAARSRSPPSCPDPGTRGRVMADSDISSPEQDCPGFHLHQSSRGFQQQMVRASPS